jgi:hypothetical protein
MCSLYRVWNDLPVWAMYLFWHWLHVSAYTPLLEYPSDCCWWSVGASMRSVLWAVLNVTPTLVRLKRFVTALTSRPVNVGFFCFTVAVVVIGCPVGGRGVLVST